MLPNSELNNNLTDYKVKREIKPEIKLDHSKLSKLLTAIKYVKNWWVFNSIFIKKRFTSHFFLVNLKDGRSLKAFNRVDLEFILNSIFYTSRIIGSEFVNEIVPHLFSISQEVWKEIYLRWGKNQAGTGGWPGNKEIILYLLVRKHLPENIVETGVAQGISSRFILEALNENKTGCLTSIDLPNYDPKGQINRDGVNDSVFVRKDLGVGWIVPDKLRQRWTLLLGDSKEILKNLSLRPDIFFHDSDHSYEHMQFEFEWAYSHLTSEGIIVSDDISWNRSFYDFIDKHKDSVKEIYSKFGTGVAKLNSAN